MVINKLKNNNIFEYTGRYILNDNSMIIGRLQFYVDVTPIIYYKKYFLEDKMTCTYSVEKKKAFLTIHKNISDKDPIVYQLCFIILNLKNDSELVSGIIPPNINKNIKINRYMEKCIHLDVTLSEHDDIYSKSYSLKEWEDSGLVGKKEVRKFNLYKTYSF
jgi:hypothetical protein